MSEKLLSERDAYELADILNAKGIDKFAEMAENIAHNQAIEKVREMVYDPVKFKTFTKACIDIERLEALRKPEGGG